MIRPTLRLGPFWFQSYEAGFTIGAGRFRIGVKDRRVHRALFSERNGYVRVLRLGPYAIRFFSSPLP